MKTYRQEDHYSYIRYYLLPDSDCYFLVRSKERDNFYYLHKEDRHNNQSKCKLKFSGFHNLEGVARTKGYDIEYWIYGKQLTNIHCDQDLVKYVKLIVFS